MCGRYTLRSKAREVAERFELDNMPELLPRYNIAPTQDVAVVGLDREGRRTLGTMRWGFPRRRGGPQINLRDDTAVQAPTFRRLLHRRRCLVVADGWYEWQPRADGSRVPNHIRLPGGGPFGFAAVWKRTEEGLACAILTCPAAPSIADLHDRMPVIASPPYEQWLEEPVQDPDQLADLLVPFAGDLAFHPVSPRVGAWQNDDPQLLEPV